MSRMDLLARLGDLEQHITRSAVRLAQRKSLVGSLERDGVACSRSRALLARGEELHAMRLAERDRLLQDLAALAA